MSFKELREETGMSLAKFGRYFNIPYRTVQNWECGKPEPAEYVLELLRYKLANENLIKGAAPDER